MAAHRSIHAALLLLLFGACSTADGKGGSKAAESTDILAKVDDVVITVQEFEELINRKAPYVRARYNSVDARKEFLDSLVRTEVLAKEAKARGFDKHPDVVRATKQVMIQKLMKEEFEDRIKPESVTDAEMKAYYDQNQPEFNKPEQIRVSAVITRSKATADTVGKLARSEEGRSNQGFRDLVDKYSSDADSKARGGDLRYFDRTTKEYPREVVEAAFGLPQLGDVAGPVAAKGQFYVLKQTGRRPAVTRSFDEVKRQIQNQLYRQKRVDAQEQFIAKLKKDAKIEVYDSVLKKIQVDKRHGTAEMAPSPDLPAFPPSLDEQPPVP